MKIQNLIQVLLFSSLMLPTRVALAAEVRTGARVHIGAGTSIDEDLYVAARELIIEGTVYGDVIAAASTVTIQGRVAGSVMAAGGTVLVNGTVGRAVRLVGGEVRINGEVGTDAVAACGTCSFGPTAKVGVDLFAAGSDLDLAGKVARDLRVAGEKVRLAGTVARQAQVRAETLRVEAPTATPSLLYGARFTTGVPAAGIGRMENHPEWIPTKPSRTSGSLVMTLMALLTGGVLLWLLPARAPQASRILAQRPGAALLWGLTVTIVAPLVIVLALVTVVALPLGLLAAATYLFGMYFGYLVSGLSLGQFLLRKMNRPVSPFAAFALGMAFLLLLSMLPVLGPLVGVLATLAGVGGLWLMLVNSSRFAARLHRPTATATDEPPVRL